MPPPLSADPDAALRVLRQFRVVFNAVKAHFQQVERESGLGGAQIWALSVIREQPGIGVGELATALSVRQPTASNLVKGLVKLELVEARREGSDKRMVQLHARPAARQLLRRAPGPRSGVLPEALGQLQAEQLRRLEADLAALIAVLGTGARGAQVPLAPLQAQRRRRA